MRHALNTRYSPYTSVSLHVTASRDAMNGQLTSLVFAVIALVVCALIVAVVICALPHIKSVDDAVEMLRVLVPWCRRKR